MSGGCFSRVGIKIRTKDKDEHRGCLGFTQCSSLGERNEHLLSPVKVPYAVLSAEHMLSHVLSSNPVRLRRFFKQLDFQICTSLGHKDFLSLSFPEGPLSTDARNLSESFAAIASFCSFISLSHSTYSTI